MGFVVAIAAAALGAVLLAVFWSEFAAAAEADDMAEKGYWEIVAKKKYRAEDAAEKEGDLPQYNMLLSSDALEHLQEKPMETLVVPDGLALSLFSCSCGNRRSQGKAGSVTEERQDVVGTKNNEANDATKGDVMA